MIRGPAFTSASWRVILPPGVTLTLVDPATTRFEPADVSFHQVPLWLQVPARLSAEDTARLVTAFKRVMLDKAKEMKRHRLPPRMEGDE